MAKYYLPIVNKEDSIKMEIVITRITTFTFIVNTNLDDFTLLKSGHISPLSYT